MILHACPNLTQAGLALYSDELARADIGDARFGNAYHHEFVGQLGNFVGALQLSLNVLADR